MRKIKLRLSAWIITLAMVFSVIPTSVFAQNAPFLPDESLNSIDDGSLSDQTTELYACFNNLIADEDYVVVVSRSASLPLDSSNLIYITQTTVPSSGTLEVPFLYDDASEIAYVAACRRDIALTGHSISVTHGTASLQNAAPGATVTITADRRDGYKFSRWSVLQGDVSLVDESKETTTFVMGSTDVRIEAVYSSDDSKPSEVKKDDGNAGVAILIGVGVVAAVAIAAGVILTQPVDVQARVELPTHEPASQVNIALLKNGNIVVQTATDETGSFNCKVQRGNYEVLVSYTDAVTGQFVSQTFSIKAPSKGVVLSLAENESNESFVQ